jgi:hypothetical protein
MLEPRFGWAINLMTILLFISRITRSIYGWRPILGMEEWDEK